MTLPRSKPGEFYRRRAAYERQIIEEAVLAHPTRTAAARSLGLSRTYLCRLMGQLGVPFTTRHP
jgi:DNA-binding NtrC family response regulator